METRALRYFVAVAEELHFARAAARVGIEQSPLSKAISEMERNLGVRLFVRTRRSTRLTFVGETLLKDAQRILAEVDQAHRNIEAAASGRVGRLRIGICDGLGHPRIARLFAQSRAEDPRVDIEIMHSALPVQLRQLYSGFIDLAFSLSSHDDQKLRSVPLWKDECVLVMRPDHPMSKTATCCRIESDLGQLILLGERPPVSAEPLAQWLLSSEQKGKRFEYVISIELLITLVAAGYGIGLISVAQAEMIGRSDLVVRPLDVNGAAITTYLISLREEASNLATRFSDRAQKML